MLTTPFIFSTQIVERAYKNKNRGDLYTAPLSRVCSRAVELLKKEKRL